MKVAIVKERRAFERRVAASPDTVKHMTGMGLEVAVETGAGDGAFFGDAAYQAAGATIAADEEAALAGVTREPARSDASPKFQRDDNGAVSGLFPPMPAVSRRAAP